MALFTNGTKILAQKKTYKKGVVMNIVTKHNAAQRMAQEMKGKGTREIAQTLMTTFPTKVAIKTLHSENGCNATLAEIAVAINGVCGLDPQKIRQEMLGCEFDPEKIEAAVTQLHN